MGARPNLVLAPASKNKLQRSLFLDIEVVTSPKTRQDSLPGHRCTVCTFLFLPQIRFYASVQVIRFSQVSAGWGCSHPLQFSACLRPQCRPRHCRLWRSPRRRGQPMPVALRQLAPVSGLRRPIPPAARSPPRTHRQRSRLPPGSCARIRNLDCAQCPSRADPPHNRQPAPRIRPLPPALAVSSPGRICQGDRDNSQRRRQQPSSLTRLWPASG